MLKHLLVPILVAWMVAPAAAAPALILESPSRYGFAESVERLKAQVKRHGWKIPKVYDMQATLKKFGHKVRPATVVSVCNPRLAAKILGNDQHRHLSAMMPCRVSIYEKSDGKTYFARVNATVFSRQLDSQAIRVLAAAGKGVEKILSPLTR